MPIRPSSSGDRLHDLDRPGGSPQRVVTVDFFETVVELARLTTALTLARTKEEISSAARGLWRAIVAFKTSQAGGAHGGETAVRALEQMHRTGATIMGRGTYEMLSAGARRHAKVAKPDGICA